MSRLKTDAIRNVNASVDGITLDTSGNVAIPNELQLADKIVHTGDTNTAIRFPSADVITAETSGTERIRVTSGGLVLLGSSTSDLSGNHSFISIGSRHALQYGASAGTYLSFIMGSANGNVTLETSARSGNYPPLLFELGGSERLRITSIGRLLIGTSTANKAGSYSTVVSTGGSANNGGFMAHYNTGAYGGGSMTTANGGGGGLIFWTYTGNLGSESYSERLRITSAGNVGIGCTPSNGFLEVKNTSYNGGSTGFLTLEGGGESGVMFKTSSYGNDQNKIGTNNNGHMFFRVAAGTRASLTSNGLCFNSDTSASNALNDYEIGAWTVTDDSGAGLTFNINHTARYVKIGNLVNIQFDITFPSTSNTAHPKFNNPFTGGHNYGGGHVNWINYAGGLVVHIGANDMWLSKADDSDGSFQNADLSGKRVIANVCYQIS